MGSENEERQKRCSQMMRDQRTMYEELLVSANGDSNVDGECCGSCSDLQTKIDIQDKELKKLRSTLQHLVGEFKTKMIKIKMENHQFAESNYQIRKENKRLK